MRYDTKDRKQHPSRERDVRVKIFNKVIYFRNTYHLLSLINDILLGLLYFGGSIANIVGLPSIVGNVLYLLGGFFFVMRPVINFIQNVHTYDYEEVEEFDDPKQRERNKDFEYTQASEEETDQVREEHNHDDDYEHY